MNEENNCHKNCYKDCYQEYYSMSLDNHYYNIESDSEITIKYKYSKVFHYISEPEIPLHIYISNMCGLFGIFVGLTILDFNILLKRFFIFIYFKLNLNYFIEMIKISFHNSRIKTILFYLTLTIIKKY